MNRHLLSPYVRYAAMSVLPPEHRIAARIIYDHELIRVGGGHCDITVGGRTYTCKKGDVILLRPNARHEFRCPPDDSFVQPHIHFDLIYGEKSEATPISFKTRDAMSAAERALIQPDILPPSIPYVFTPVDAERFDTLFFDVIDQYRRKTSAGELITKARMLELLCLIIEQFEPHRRAEDDTASSVAAVKSYIDSNFRQVLSLDGLSGQFYINKFTLMRNFKARYGKNVIEYYRDKRVGYAKKQLAETSLPISAIGESLNFSDIYAFSRFFASQAGTSPREWRKARINEQGM